MLGVADLICSDETQSRSRDSKPAQEGLQVTMSGFGRDRLVRPSRRAPEPDQPFANNDLGRTRRGVVFFARQATPRQAVRGACGINNATGAAPNG